MGCAFRPGGSARLVETDRLSAYRGEVVRLAAEVTEKGSVLVLTRTNSERAELRLALAVAGVRGVEVLTIHASKGLEVNSVIFAAGPPSAFARDGDESLRNLMYVAVTRTCHDVAVVTLSAVDSRVAGMLGA